MKVAKGTTRIKTLSYPTAEAWNHFYAFQLKVLDIKIEALQAQRSKMVGEIEELGLLHKKFAKTKVLVNWTWKKP